MRRPAPCRSRCGTRPDKILVTVQDDGSGFDPERVRGLGLLGMEERARHLGGTFHIDSRPGRGTLLRVTLPLSGAFPKPSKAMFRRQPNSPPRWCGTEAWRMAQIRILLADDHNILRDGMRLLLERQPGFVVVGEAADGRETLQLARISAPTWW
jgi:hypothetical protein